MAETKMKQLQHNVLHDYNRQGEGEVAVFSAKRRERRRKSREDLIEAATTFYDAQRPLPESCPYDCSGCKVKG